MMITKKMRDFLEWANVAGPYRTWPIEWSVMQRKARDAGFVDRSIATHESRIIGFAVYRISESGRAALKEADG